MTSKELMMFTTVYEYGSISKAAERLYITQPSLSRVIQKIESDIGTELFRRTSDGLKPTAAGDIYMNSAEKMMALYRELESSLSALHNGSKGKIILGTTFFLGANILPLIISSFNRLFPNIEIKIIEGTSTEIENELVKGLVDVAVIHLPLQASGLNYFTVATESFLIAIPEDHALNNHTYTKPGVQRPFLDVKLTENMPYILTHPNQRARQECERICSLAGFEPKVKLVTRNLQTATRLVAQGSGCTLLPYSYAKLYNPDCLPNFYNIDEQYKPQWDVAVVINNKLSTSKLIEEFIEICKEILPVAFEV